MYLRNNADAGTAAATVATSDTGSGTPWDVVSIGASGTLTYDATHPAHGGRMGIKVGQPAALVAIYFGWSSVSGGQALAGQGLGNPVGGSFYYWGAAAPTSTIRAVSFWNGTTELAALGIASGTHQLGWRNNADASVGTQGTAIPTSTLVKVVFEVRGLGTGATGLSGNARWFTGDLGTGSTLDATCSGANGGAVLFDTVRFGAGIASGTASTSHWVDDFELYDAQPGARTWAPGV